jgi:hypothetical protein
MPIKPFDFYEEAMSYFSTVEGGDGDLEKAFADSAPFPESSYLSAPTGKANRIVAQIQQNDLLEKVLGQDLTEQLNVLEKAKQNAPTAALTKAISQVADSSVAKLEYTLSKRSEIGNKMGVLVHDLKKNLRAIGCDLTGISFDSLERNMASYVQNALMEG